MADLRIAPVLLMDVPPCCNAITLTTTRVCSLPAGVSDLLIDITTNDDICAPAITTPTPAASDACQICRRVYPKKEDAYEMTPDMSICSENVRKRITNAFFTGQDTYDHSLTRVPVVDLGRTTPDDTPSSIKKEAIYKGKLYLPITFYTAFPASDTPIRHIKHVYH